MKSIVLVGIVIAALGGYVLLRGGSYRSRDEVIHVGDIRASVSESHDIPAWAGGVAVLAGLVLIGAGTRRRRA